MTYGKQITLISLPDVILVSFNAMYSVARGLYPKTGWTKKKNNRTELQVDFRFKASRSERHPHPNEIAEEKKPHHRFALPVFCFVSFLLFEFSSLTLADFSFVRKTSSQRKDPQMSETTAILTYSRLIETAKKKLHHCLPVVHLFSFYSYHLSTSFTHPHPSLF